MLPFGFKMDNGHQLSSKKSGLVFLMVTVSSNQAQVTQGLPHGGVGWWPVGGTLPSGRNINPDAPAQ